MEQEKLLPDIEFQKKSKIRLIILLPILVILLALTICFIVLYIQEKNKNSDKGEDNSSEIPSDIPEDDQSYNEYIPLSSWNNCSAKTKLSEFISKINSAEYYVPKEDRIAVFDLDGTLFQETDPTYDDWKLYYYRVYNDTNFTSTEEQKQIADAIKQASIDNHMPDDLNWRVASTYTQLFYNMTIEEYQQYIINFVNQPCEGYENMKRGDAFYKPMLELIEYIQKNDFNVYITSGTDRYQVRTVAKNHTDIPESNVIGSEYNIIAKNQGTTAGNEYTYKNDDDFRFDGQFLRKNLKTNKVIGIIREIGKQPILSFGNSGGDKDMANYVINKNKYPSLAFMVCCDDTERERGNIEKANEMKNNCNNFGWIPISMKDDWKTIYEENVRKKTN
jgi:phosphoglycolate phosphatase-like HAD superfamily hydrolase